MTSNNLETQINNLNFPYCQYHPNFVTNMVCLQCSHEVLMCLQCQQKNHRSHDIHSLPNYLQESLQTNPYYEITKKIEEYKEDTMGKLVDMKASIEKHIMSYEAYYEFLKTKIHSKQDNIQLVQKVIQQLQDNQNVSFTLQDLIENNNGPNKNSGKSTQISDFPDSKQQISNKEIMKNLDQIQKLIDEEIQQLNKAMVQFIYKNDQIPKQEIVSINIFKKNQFNQVPIKKQTLTERITFNTVDDYKHLEMQKGILTRISQSDNKTHYFLSDQYLETKGDYYFIIKIMKKTELLDFGVVARSVADECQYMRLWKQKFNVFLVDSYGCSWEQNSVDDKDFSIDEGDIVKVGYKNSYFYLQKQNLSKDEASVLVTQLPDETYHFAIGIQNQYDSIQILSNVRQQKKSTLNDKQNYQQNPNSDCNCKIF